MRGYLVTEGGFCCGEGGLRDEFVVLCCLSQRGQPSNTTAIDEKFEGPKRTRTVLRTLTSRGKSETPWSRVSTEDSRNLRDVWREDTQSA